MKNRNISVDVIKGVLIILVLIGHIVYGGARDNFIRYMIYSIHMPLFMGCSGYLVSCAKMRRWTFKEIVLKYTKRLILPWMLASFIYAILNNGFTQFSGTKAFLKSIVLFFLQPWYHLWFVPALVGYVFFTWIIVKLTKKILDVEKVSWLVLGMALIISVLTIFLRRIEIATFSNNTILLLARKVLVAWQFDNYFYFVLGVTFAQTRKYIKCYKPFGELAVGMFCVRMLLFFTDWQIAEANTLFYILMNFPLCICMFWGFDRNKFEINNRIVKGFAILGKNTFPIYLYHVLLIRLADYINNVYKYNHDYRYYIMVLSFLIVFGAILHFTKRIFKGKTGAFLRAEKG